jgi:hypothetical protein
MRPNPLPGDSDVLALLCDPESTSDGTPRLDSDSELSRRGMDCERAGGAR